MIRRWLELHKAGELPAEGALRAIEQDVCEHGVDFDVSYCRKCQQGDRGAIAEPVYECCNDACPWRGIESETVHPKHDPSHLLCPECHEVVEKAD